MLCSTEQFTAQAKRNDIGESDSIFLYDTHMMFGVARAAWMFTLFGFQAYVLDGPIQKWIQLGYTIDSSLISQDESNH